MGAVNSLDDFLLAIDIVSVQWNRRFLEPFTFPNSFNSFNSFNSNQKLFCFLCQTLHCYPRFFSDFQSRTNFRSSWRSEKSGSHCNHGIIELQGDVAKIPGSHLQHNDRKKRSIFPSVVMLVSTMSLYCVDHTLEVKHEHEVFFGFA